MPYQLDTTFNLPAGSRIDVERPSFDEELERCTVLLRLISAPGTNAQIAEVALTLTNIQSDQVARQGAPAPGLAINNQARYFTVTKRTTPTAYTDAVNAWRAAAAPGARRSAFETYLLSAGHIDATLAAG